MRYYFSPVYILSRLEVLHLPIMSRTYFPPCPQMWQCERSSIPLARLCVRARVCVCVCVCALLNFVLGQGDRKPLGLHNRSDGDFITYGQLCGSRGEPISRIYKQLFAARYITASGAPWPYDSTHANRCIIQLYKEHS